jgi:parallel beta-helix repeat protein
MATTYYVSGTGNDSSDGLSTGSAFRSLQKAANLVQAGDTVLVMDGTYEATGKAVLQLQNKQGNENNPITFKAYPGAKPVIKNSDGGYPVIIDGSSYITIDGFTIIGPNDNITLEYAESQKYVTTNRLTRGTGISISPQIVNGEVARYSHHIVIRNNTISKFPGGGVGVDRADYITIENNTISETSLYSNLGHSAISILHSHNIDNNTTDYKFIIQGNVIFDNQQFIPWTQATQPTEGHGIILDSNRNREIDAGIEEDPYKGRFLVANNTIYNNGGFGINVFQSENADIVNNTLYQNSRDPNLKGEIVVINSGNVRAENNIMSARDGSRANMIYQSKDVVFDNNITYNSSVTFQAASPPNATMGSGQSYVDSSAQTAAVANVINAELKNYLEQNPLFIDPANGNFSLQAGSPAVDTGSNQFSSVVGTDALKTTRRDGDGINGVQTDIGAYEYTGAPALTSAYLFIAAKDSVKAEGNSGTTPFTFTITRTGNTNSAVSVDYALTGSGSKVVNAADFGGVLPTGTINFAANETSKTLTVNVQGETIAEPDEGFTVTLSNASVGAAIATHSAKGIIQNDDSATLEARSVNTYQSEGDTGTTPFTFNVIRSGILSGTTEVTYTVSAGTGTNPVSADDLESGFSTGKITFLPNETVKQVAINVKGDLTNETNESFLVFLSNTTGGATITNAAIGATILNDDAKPVVTIVATDAHGAEAGADPGQFTFTRTGSTTDPLIVHYYLTGTAQNSVDYTTPTNTLVPKVITIPAGASSATVTIKPKDDALAEGTETVVLTLEPTSTYKIGTSSFATLTIADDELPSAPPILAIAATDAIKAEGNSGTQPYTFTVTRGGEVLGETSVHYAVTGSGANPANIADFGGTFPVGTVNFAAGETSKVITVHASGDNIIEANESFTVMLSNPTGGATLTTATATGIIQDEDGSTAGNTTPTVTGKHPFSYTVDASAFVGLDSGTLSYQATLEDGSSLPSWLTFDSATRTFSGTPSNFNTGTFTVSLAASDGKGGSARKTFTLTVEAAPNTAPGFDVTQAAPDLAIREDTPFSYTVNASAFVDPDGDSLSYQATLEDGSSLPSWLTFDPITRTLSGTPTSADAGTFTVSITASDGNGGSIKDTFTLTVQEVLPTQRYGTKRPDKLVGKGAKNHIYGLGKNDRITGASGQDQLYGGKGNDRLWARQGNDRLYGGAGNDRMWGEDNDDLLFGGAGNDKLYGGAGNDWLYGEAGNDTISGGTGIDTYVLNQGKGMKTIRDFELGIDKIAIAGGLALSDVTIRQRGSQSWLINSSNSQVLAKLDGINAATLSAQASTTLSQI